MSTSNTPVPHSSPPFYIKNLLQQVAAIGVVLFAGPGIFAFPHQKLKAHPGLLQLVRIHRYEIAHYLHDLVE